ncbi:FAD-dependent monooxygenase [uncultured Roseobacter sp.]|uniref:FAD binding domain-containing protein n=1 Tax=uncultured Roseobacter sp. TaxID=114847 RepID=UPI002618DD53|nr:FAD-dependent monooxygenase [uncultured Roseobacter sp.]
MGPNAPFSAAVVGGSVGGLAAAIELRDRLQADVAVYERSTGQMQARGAGVVMQPEVDALLSRIGVSTRSVCVELRERVGLARDGRAQASPAPQLMTAWDTLYRTLKTHLGGDCYHQNSRLTALSQDQHRITATFADGHSVSADILIAADGVNSAARHLLLGAKADARYTGYVAWRGLEDEAALPPVLVNALAGRFTSFMHPGMQMLCYLVPGADGATEPGQRRVNWVWYVNTPEVALDRYLTGASGTRYRSFLPADDMDMNVSREMAKTAARTLPPLFRNLVEASRLFMQPVQDVVPQARIHGRAVLIGDAAGTVRPHTAAGTSKAFGDATLLAEALKDWRSEDALPTDVLDRWAVIRDRDLQVTAQRGYALAARSGLGRA